MQFNSYLKLVKAIPGDLITLSELALTTFKETYGGQFLSENFEKYTRDAFNIITLEMEINDPSCTFFLASLENVYVGYVKLKEFKADHSGDSSLIQPVDFAGGGIQLERFYLLKGYHRHMIGAFMIHFLLEYSKTKSCKFVWLGVWELNAQAIRFFTSWHFRMYSSRVFKFGNERQRDVLLKKDL